jgi:hypothetical protein
MSSSRQQFTHDEAARLTLENLRGTHSQIGTLIKALEEQMSEQETMTQREIIEDMHPRQLVPLDIDKVRIS